MRGVGYEWSFTTLDRLNELICEKERYPLALNDWVSDEPEFPSHISSIGRAMQSQLVVFAPWLSLSMMTLVNRAEYGDNWKQKHLHGSSDHYMPWLDLKHLEQKPFQGHRMKWGNGSIEITI